MAHASERARTMHAQRMHALTMARKKKYLGFSMEVFCAEGTAEKPTAGCREAAPEGTDKWLKAGGWKERSLIVFLHMKYLLTDLALTLRVLG